MDALEQHLASLEGKKGSAANTPTQSARYANFFHIFNSFKSHITIDVGIISKRPMLNAIEINILLPLYIFPQSPLFSSHCSFISDDQKHVLLHIFISFLSYEYLNITFIAQAHVKIMTQNCVRLF